VLNVAVAHCEEHFRKFFHVFACFYLLENKEVDFAPLFGHGGVKSTGFFVLCK
jgi:hypothetical protein